MTVKAQARMWSAMTFSEGDSISQPALPPMSGVAPGSHAAEDQLLAALASAAVKQFVANAGNM